MTSTPAIPSIDTPSFEVWLLDTGYFLVLKDVPMAWMASLSWRKLMRQRRVLRMFVAASELPKLPGLELSFKVAKRGFEMAETMKRHHVSVTAGKLPVEVITKNTLTLLDAHASLLPTETRSPIKTVPWEPPPVVVSTVPEPKTSAPKKGKGKN